jgi:hypothetical protein
MNVTCSLFESKAIIQEKTTQYVVKIQQGRLSASKLMHASKEIDKPCVLAK